MKATDAPTVLQMQDGRADIIEKEFATLHTKMTGLLCLIWQFMVVFTALSPQEVQIELLQRSPREHGNTDRIFYNNW